MANNERQGASLKKEDEVAAEQSPSEKLEGKMPPGATVPGAQNPDSKEIKKEINPNTE